MNTSENFGVTAYQVKEPGAIRRTSFVPAGRFTVVHKKAGQKKVGKKPCGTIDGVLHSKQPAIYAALYIGLVQ
jgi:hypothetical protein